MKSTAPLHAFFLSALVGLGSACGAAPADAVPVVAVAGGSDSPRIVEPSGTTTIETKDAPTPTKITWLTSEDEARAKSKSRELPLVVFLCADWAVPAVKMDRETWTDPRIVQRSRGFVALRLDVTEADGNAQAEADHFDLRTMPSTIFLDDHGDEIVRLEGFASADAVVTALDALHVPGG